jgi:hypothetical protein
MRSMTDTIAELGALRKGIQDALDGVTPNTLTYAGWVTSIARKYLNGEITYSGNRQTPVGRVIGFLLDNFFTSFEFTNGTLDSRITLTRASAATYRDNTGTRQTAAINVARFDHTSGGVALGLLIEEQRTNYLLNSGAPATQSVTLGTGIYTLWVEGSGSATSAAGTAVGTGFGAATDGSPNVFTLTGAGTVSITVTGSVTIFQLENGAFATSYIPTTGATATRSADVAAMTGTNFSSWYNQAQGTFLCEFTTLSTAGNRYPFSANDTTLNNRINLFSNAGEQINNRFVVAGVASNPATTGNILINGASNKVGIAYKAGTDGVGSVFNGGTVQTSSPSDVPFLTRLEIGQNLAAEHLNGWIKSIKYYQSRLSNAQLQALTT